MKRVPFTATEEVFHKSDGFWSPIMHRNWEKRKQKAVQINLTINPAVVKRITKVLNNLVSKELWNHEHFELWDDDEKYRLHIILREERRSKWKGKPRLLPLMKAGIKKPRSKS
jgi:hypothetical protein